VNKNGLRRALCAWLPKPNGARASRPQQARQLKDRHYQGAFMPTNALRPGWPRSGISATRPPPQPPGKECGHFAKSRVVTVPPPV